MFFLKSRATHTSHLTLQTRCQFDNVKSYVRVGYVHETETSLGRLPVFDLYDSRRKKMDLRDLMRGDAMRRDATRRGVMRGRGKSCRAKDFFSLRRKGEFVWRTLDPAGRTSA